jgi:hypothetical protein
VRKLLAKVTRGGCEGDGLPRGWVKASSHQGKYVTWTAKDGELFTSLPEAQMYAGLSSLERMEFRYQVVYPALDPKSQNSEPVISISQTCVLARYLSTTLNPQPIPLNLYL